MNKWTAIHAREVPPVEGETQRRCWQILGPDPISQCVFFNGHEGQHWFGTTEGRWVPEGEACCGPAAQIIHVQSQGGKIHMGLGERCEDNIVEGAAPRAEGLVRDLLAALETEIALHPYEADAPTTVIEARNRARQWLSRPSDERVPESEER